MFGFGKVHGFNRKDWNTEVDRVLQDRIGIDTMNRMGGYFPGVLAYGRILDDGWDQKLHPHWHAILTALNFWGGCVINGDEDARKLASGFQLNLIAFTQHAVMRGIIPQEKLMQIVKKLEETSAQYGIENPFDSD